MCDIRNILCVLNTDASRRFRVNKPKHLVIIRTRFIRVLEVAPMRGIFETRKRKPFTNRIQYVNVTTFTSGMMFHSIFGKKTNDKIQYLLVCDYNNAFGSSEISKRRETPSEIRFRYLFLIFHVDVLTHEKPLKNRSWSYCE